MKAILFSAAMASLVTSASAAPLLNQANSVANPSIAENVKIVCQADGYYYPPKADRRLPVGFTVTTPFVVPIADPVTTAVLAGALGGGG